MNVEILARRYAKAFLNTLAGPADVASALSELKRMDALITGHKELREALFHPTFPTSRKTELLRAVLNLLKPSERVTNFCLAIVERGRVVMFSEIVKAVEREWERRQKVIEVEIRSAVPLKSVQRQRLEAELARLTGSKLKPIYKLDDSIVAGIVTRIGTKFYDGSLKGQLARLREHLAGG